ncbi:MAG: NAD-dependent epimerase/dehydratase family protein, partial [Eubacteriales bacterium]|nr:NAD-dependent epimerase/dehydratase family protein [Eubacteriales bacterium]
KYYNINTNLAIEVAKKAKDDKVKQFIYLSSIIIYNDIKEKVINYNTIPKSSNYYGDSKLQADLEIQKLQSSDYNVCILRLPMIYGKNCKGNFALLQKISKKSLFFPIYNNERSMLYIENLCMFILLMIENNEKGVFFPQNEEYSNTSTIVKLISKYSNKKIIMIKGFSFLINILKQNKGKIGILANKAFGDKVYDKNISKYKYKYQIFSLEQSIKRIEES